MIAPKVAIIIVNFNGRADTLECLASLAGLTYPNVETVMVENGSSDGTAQAVREAFPAVHVLESVENLGFAGGNNLGIRDVLARGADYIFLLNNDTTVEPGLLEPLVAYAEANPKVGMVGPTMLYYDQPEVVWSAGAGMDDRGTSSLVGEGNAPEPKDGKPREVDFIIGCGLLLKRAVLEQVGLLDEDYFLYYEETDLCYRAKKAGWQCFYHPGSRLWHKISRSTGASSDLTLYYMRRNALRFVERHSRTPLAGRFALLMDDFRLLLVWTLQGQTGRRQALWWAMTDYFTKRFGKTNRFQTRRL